MFTIANGIILKCQDLVPSRENIVVEDGKIIEISKESAEGKIIDVKGIVDSFDGEYQIKVFNAKNITIN